MLPFLPAIGLVGILTLPADCPSCTLDLRLVVSLGRDHALALRDPAFVFLHDGRGHYLVGDGHYVSELIEFDAEGRFLGLRGQAGEGPGEFQGVRALYRWRADSVLALDQTLGRLTVLSPSLTFARARPFTRPSVGGPALLDDGRLLVWELGKEGNRARLVPIDGDGPDRLVDSIAPGWAAAPRLFARAAGGGYWLGRMDRYRFTLHAVDGAVVRAVGRDAPWMAGADGPVGLPTALRPNPRVVALQDDGERLWVWGLVAAPDWAPSIATSHVGEGPALPSATTLSRLFDTIVEVLDRETGEPLVSRRFAGAYLATAEPGWATRAVRTPEGRSEIEVVRVEVTIR